MDRSPATRLGRSSKSANIVFRAVDIGTRLARARWPLTRPRTFSTSPSWGLIWGLAQNSAALFYICQMISIQTWRRGRDPNNSRVLGVAPGSPFRTQQVSLLGLNDNASSSRYKAAEKTSPKRTESELSSGQAVQRSIANRPKCWVSRGLIPVGEHLGKGAGGGNDTPFQTSLPRDTRPRGQNRYALGSMGNSNVQFTPAGEKSSTPTPLSASGTIFSTTTRPKP